MSPMKVCPGTVIIIVREISILICLFVAQRTMATEISSSFNYNKPEIHLSVTYRINYYRFSILMVDFVRAS